MDQDSKKTILIVIWCVAAALLVIGGAWAWYSMSQYKTYRNAEYKFIVKYPSEWKMMEHYQGTAVTFVKPKQTALDVFQPNVNITIQEVPAKIATLKSFSETITKQMTVVFKKSIVIKEDKDVIFGGRPGHRLVVDAPKPSNLRMMFVWTIKGPFAYLFTFMGQGKQYQDLMPTIDQMTKSFAFK